MYWWVPQTTLLVRPAGCCIPQLMKMLIWVPLCFSRDNLWVLTAFALFVWYWLTECERVLGRVWSYKLRFLKKLGQIVLFIRVGWNSPNVSHWWEWGRGSGEKNVSAISLILSSWISIAMFFVYHLEWGRLFSGKTRPGNNLPCSLENTRQNINQGDEQEMIRHKEMYNVSTGRWRIVKGSKAGKLNTW